MPQNTAPNQLPADHELLSLLTPGGVIAIVGLSPDPQRDSNRVARYMLEQGYKIIPVNPALTSILGQTCYPSLKEIPEPVQLVDVFRRTEAVPEIAEQALAIGAKGLWLQLGIEHPEAAAKARRAGLLVVQNRCLKVEHQRLHKKF